MSDEARVTKKKKQQRGEKKTRVSQLGVSFAAHAAKKAGCARARAARRRGNVAVVVVVVAIAVARSVGGGSERGLIADYTLAATFTFAVAHASERGVRRMCGCSSRTGQRGVVVDQTRRRRSTFARIFLPMFAARLKTERARFFVFSQHHSRRSSIANAAAAADCSRNCERRRRAAQSLIAIAFAAARAFRN